MTNKHKSVWAALLAALIILSILGGCSGAGAGTVSPEPTATEAPAVTDEPVATEAPETSSTPEPDPQPTDEPLSAGDAFKAVLLGQAEFFSVDANESLGLDTLAACVSIDESIPVEATAFAVLDLDGDGENEVILNLRVNNDLSYGYEILRMTDGEIFGSAAVYRAFIEPKADGTFSFSSGAADSGFGRYSFADGQLVLNSETYSEYAADGAISYYVNREPADEDAFSAALAEQNAKPDAAWYSLTDANIDALAAGELVSAAVDRIAVDYAPEELLAQPAAFDEFIEPEAETSDFLVKASLTAVTELRDFKLLAISLNDTGESFNVDSVLYESDALAANRPFVFGTTFPGDMPTRGVSYVDGTGTERIFALGMSGKDGSLLLIEF